MVTGSGSTASGADFVAKNQAAFAEALDQAGGATVVAGRVGHDEANNVINQLRGSDSAAEAVSTVDAVDQTWGRLATVLAVAEQLESGSGAYGFSENADEVLPEH